MKTLKSLSIILAHILISGFAVSALSQELQSETTISLSSGSTDMTDGEIRKIDTDNKKITVKHGEIKNLEMPGMTIVFQVKDPALLDKIKVGGKIKFRAEKPGSAFVITEIQAK